MPYDLLTGATGLLGNYLLRDGLAAGRQIAVVVRPGIAETTRQRVENILARWERELGYALPRPPVLEGDICKPDLGLSHASLDWVAKHCVSVLHNAASLSFEADERSGEPHRSNVEGTRNVLTLCRRVGIRQFHHVSTAYVCGLRSGRILESELDVGQQMGNVYEQSKVEGEKLVREADFLDPPTIYRPAIIIGDSLTGYTTTFHGFYALLKIGHALVDRLPATEIETEPLMAALGLSGTECKNLVPVDWVSQVITHLHGRPEHHGRTYHLTPLRRVPAATICEVTKQILNERMRQSGGKNVAMPDLAELEKVFVDQMGVYQAYWRDDPEFDQSNTAEAAPDLPCPDVTFEMLLCTSEYAVKTNFGWPRPRAIVPDFDVANHMASVLPIRDGGDPPDGDTVRVSLQVNGPGGGQWTLVVDGDRPIAIEVGLDEEPESLLYLNSKTFHQCLQGKLTAQEAVRLGRVVVEFGQLSSADHLMRVLQAVVTEHQVRPLQTTTTPPNSREKRPVPARATFMTQTYSSVAERCFAMQRDARCAMKSEHSDTAVAVVGMACRLPGADNLDQFWNLLREGRQAWGPVPEPRFNRRLYIIPRKARSTSRTQIWPRW